MGGGLVLGTRLVRTKWSRGRTWSSFRIRRRVGSFKNRGFRENGSVRRRGGSRSDKTNCSGRSGKSERGIR